MRIMVRGRVAALEGPDLEDLNASRASMDEALVSLLPEGLSNVGAAQGRTRLATLMTLRWLAVAEQPLRCFSSILGWGSVCLYRCV